jgi:hypothetical protein
MSSILSSNSNPKGNRRRFKGAGNGIIFPRCRLGAVFPIALLRSKPLSISDNLRSCSLFCALIYKCFLCVVGSVKMRLRGNRLVTVNFKGTFVRCLMVALAFTPMPVFAQETEVTIAPARIDIVGMQGAVATQRLFVRTPHPIE